MLSQPSITKYTTFLRGADITVESRNTVLLRVVDAKPISLREVKNRSVERAQIFSNGSTLNVLPTLKVDTKAEDLHNSHTSQELGNKEETIRIVLLLSDPTKNYVAALALLQSLSQSANSTSMPPLIIIPNNTIRSPQQDFFKLLGAQVLSIDAPHDLSEASRIVNKSWRSFARTVLFQPQLVQSDIVLYIDVDSVARGDLMSCMRDNIIQPFRSRRELDMMAVGDNDYFNSGVLLLRSSDTTYKYMIDLLRNGTCYTQDQASINYDDVTNSSITMPRRVVSDHDLFLEYTARFPERFQPIKNGSPFNLRPMHFPTERNATCSIVHYIGLPKPWGAWFKGENMDEIGRDLPLLDASDDLPAKIQSLLSTSKSSRDWSIRLWRDRWNDAVNQWRSINQHRDSSTTVVLKQEEYESIRFVLFLSNAKYFAGALTTVHSLVQSVTSKPPLVMVMNNDTLQDSQQELLEYLGAEVLQVSVPDDLQDAMKANKVSGRWQGVFTKMLFFNRNLVHSDIVFYIDTDAVARGNLTSCMSSTIADFRNNPSLDIMAVGDREYYNNGVMLARTRDRAYDSMVELLRNGTCYGKPNCANSTTQMNRRISTDQDIFVEYGARFPDRYQPISNGSPFNLRPMHTPKEYAADCSIVHYVGTPKPWGAWFEGENMTEVGINLPLLDAGDTLPSKVQSVLNSSKFSRDWSMRLWRDDWNEAVQKWRSRPTATSR